MHSISPSLGSGYFASPLTSHLLTFGVQFPRRQIQSKLTMHPVLCVFMSRGEGPIPTLASISYYMRHIGDETHYQHVRLGVC